MTKMQPIFILPESTLRNTGKDAQKTNIAAAKIVSETVRTTLGPKGMDKMLVDSMGDVTVTNDGVTILQEMQIEHPAAKMIVEVAKTQEKEVGDGTTTAVVLVGELLKQAEGLLDRNIHSTVIAKGYRQAAEEAIKFFTRIAENISEKDEETLKKVALTAMTGKGAEMAKERLSELSVKAVKQIVEDGKIDLDNIKLEKRVGSGVYESEMIQGIILDKEKLHPSMPNIVKNARIALLDCAIEIKNTENDSKIEITSPEQMQAFIEQEERLLRKMVEKVVQSKANVVVCQKGIDDLAQHFLAKAGVYACRRVKRSDMEKLTKATGAVMVSNLNDLTESELGKAGVVESIKIGDDDMTYVKECANPKAVTILIRGGTQHIVDEVERAMKDALGDIAAALKDGKVVAGAGAAEIEVARELRNFATSLSGREQLAVLAFADSLEVIPRTLAENAGLDPIDMLTELKAAHDKKQKWAGIDVFNARVFDAWNEGVIEPLKIKTQAVKSASEVAELILRIDDVIASGKDKAQMPHGMHGGMPGMGGMGGMGGEY